jgi:exosortase/archaeosortase family protein
MTETKPQQTNTPTQNQKKVRIFLILALTPLPLLFYYNPIGAIILTYGYLLLLIKQQKLITFKHAKTWQQILGAATLLPSLLAYYAIILVYPEPAFYGAANYALHILALFLIFFETRALKEAFTPLFLIAATTLSSYAAAGLKPYITPFADELAYLVTNILRAIGINANVTDMVTVPVITLRSLTGRTVSGALTYECMGISSALIFAIILVVVLMEDPSPIKTRIIYSVIGLAVTFALNILRVTMIFITDYFYGAEVGATMHYIIGYTVFTIWLVCFLYIYSKRQTIHNKITKLWKKPQHETEPLQQPPMNHPS